MIREVIAIRRNEDGHTQSLDLSCGHSKELRRAEIDKLAEKAARDRGTLATDCTLCNPANPREIAKMRPIPVSAAQHIAEEYGYDQVIIYGRRCHDSDPPHGEHLATYGRTKQHCSVAARMADTLKKIMGWQTAKDQWVEQEAAKEYAAMRDEGQPTWGELTDETKERWREPLCREWDED